MNDQTEHGLQRSLASRRHGSLLPAALMLVLAAIVTPGMAQTYIYDEPLATRPNVTAKPNLMFILDDSGSMAREFMPDDMTSTGTFGYRSAQCNGLAYDPSNTYAPPVQADGTAYPDASFTAAWSDGFAKSGATNLDNPSGTTRTVTTSASVTPGLGSKTFKFTTTLLSGDLNIAAGDVVRLTAASGSIVMVGTVTSLTVANPSYTYTMVVDVATTSGGTTAQTGWTFGKVAGNVYYTYNNNGTQPKMGWSYNSTTVIKDTFYTECFYATSSNAGANLFTRVTVTSASAEAQKYANWYAYYRTRSMLMRTAVGQAFSKLNDGYRVGFSTINSSTNVTTAEGFHPVDDFVGTQKSEVFRKLYAAPADGGTPLRGALSKAGRYFAKQYVGQKDPVQYSCQRNYALLSTDGYWNNGGGTENSSSYGPFGLTAGTEVGNQDGTEDRPLFDGTVTTTTSTRTRYTVGNGGSSNCASNRYPVTVEQQTFTNGIWTTTSKSGPSCERGTFTVAGSTAAQRAGTVFDTTPVTNTETSGGSSNSLADVAAYYYKTPLRTTALGNCTSDTAGTAQNLCTNSVKPSPNGRDIATYQHMTTFTIGLGVSGTLTYDRNYLTQTQGDYVNLKNGTVNWPAPTTSLSGNSGDARNIDDLWHAAVNGRGQYYSALNAAELSAAISGVVSEIDATPGSASAASTSALELVSGDNNQVFKASYTTKTWVGDVQAYSLNGDTAAIGTTAVWSAQSKLAAMAYTARKIYYRQSGATPSLRAFEWSNLNADGYGSYFSGLCTQTVVTIAQCAALSTDEKTKANSGENLVNFLRGQRTYESASTANSTTRPLFRPRTAVLGDIVNGAPVYVGKPPFSYFDTGYSAFVVAKKSRKPAVYAAANDGMLHAFSAATADGGTELWAYVPQAVMPNMQRLADSGYETKHRYFVDGAPVVGDIKVGTEWKSILVGGLGKGGRSYYALDITDPEAPKTLWEFTDTNLGLSFGNPVITKRKDGTWVVVFASGYNNHENGGDGKGRLFVLNANTGQKLLDIATTAGSTTDPSGLAKINTWIDDASDNTSKRFYGGDLQGNLWRFDIDSYVLPYQSALLLAQFKINASTPQPITTRPETVEISGKSMIIVGTGRYLGTDDIVNTTQQSIYAVKDPLVNTSLGDVRTNNSFVRKTLTVVGTTATISNNSVNLGSQNGWWVDLPNTGERVATDMALQFGTLSVGTALPNGDACSSGGSSWRYYLNASDGNSLSDPAGEQWSASALIVGQSWVKLDNGQSRILRQNSDGSIRIERPPGGGGALGLPHRSSWRELVN